MRTLIYVPIIHTSADLGSMGKDVAEKGAGHLGVGLWGQHTKTVNGFWMAVTEYFESIDPAGVKLYQDGMVGEGEIGQRIVDETAKAGSPNYKLLLELIQKGATLIKTEDLTLVKAEYECLLAITRAPSRVRKLLACLAYKFRKNGLLKKRDAFIAQRINDTLGPGDQGILFIGASHRVREHLSEDIQVLELKDVDKVSQYQRMLPYQKVYGEQCAQLGQYLMAKIDR